MKGIGSARMLTGLKPLVKKLVPEAILRAYARREAEASLSPRAKAQRAEDRSSGRRSEISATQAIALSAQWLCRAQDQSTSADGGVARHFSLNTGWSPSYPETTGYIVPTFIDLASYFQDTDYSRRAQAMLDWLVSIQLPEGAFQGGLISHYPVPVTFNTGQILLGLAAGARAYDSSAYRDAMMKAATWLRDTQDDDGCWRRFATPFAAKGEKTYETHVSWGLLEAERLAPGHGFGASALKQIHWARLNVQPNGWIRDCCLSDPTKPLTHTLGYALKGFVEGYRWSHEPQLRDTALHVARGLARCVRNDGFLPGRLDQSWTGAVDWACLTGSVQVAASFADLSVWTRDAALHDASARLIRYVRQTIHPEGLPDVLGGVAGSFPIDGCYGAYEYLNWAAKFFLDAQMMEQRAALAGNSEQKVG